MAIHRGNRIISIPGEIAKDRLGHSVFTGEQAQGTVEFLDLTDHPHTIVFPQCAASIKVSAAELEDTCRFQILPNPDNHTQNGLWSAPQIEALVPGAPVKYLERPARVLRVLASGISIKCEPYKVVEAQYDPKATVTTGLSVGDRIGFFAPT